LLEMWLVDWESMEIEFFGKRYFTIVRFKTELTAYNTVELNMETASREWPTGERPMNDSTLSYKVILKYNSK
jgi:hypothetical protein